MSSVKTTEYNHVSVDGNGVISQEHSSLVSRYSSRGRFARSFLSMSVFVLLFVLFMVSGTIIEFSNHSGNYLGTDFLGNSVPYFDRAINDPDVLTGYAVGRGIPTYTLTRVLPTNQITGGTFSTDSDSDGYADGYGGFPPAGNGVVNSNGQYVYGNNSSYNVGIRSSYTTVSITNGSKYYFKADISTNWTPVNGWYRGCCEWFEASG